MIPPFCVRTVRGRRGRFSGYVTDSADKSDAARDVFMAFLWRPGGQLPEMGPQDADQHLLGGDGGQEFPFYGDRLLHNGPHALARILL